MTLVGGRWIAQHGLPHHDHLTLAGAGRRWIDEQWLAQWTMYELWRLGGYALLAIAAAALVASSFGALAWILLERGSQPRRAVKWTVLAFAVTLPDVAVRAQDFAYPLFALLLWLLLRERLVLTLPVLVVWANLHGSVLVGSALVASASLRRARDLPIGVAALAAPLATPYGVDVVHYYRSVLGNPSLQRFASEWKPAWADPLAAAAFFALVLVVGVVLVTARRRGARIPLPPLLVTAALVIAGFAELRWEAWAAFPAAVLATDLLNLYDPSPARPPRQRPWAVAAGLAAIAGIAGPVAEATSSFESTLPHPVMAVAARLPGGRILADDDSADGLLLRYPALTGRIAFDDRLEIYPPRTVDAWASWIKGTSSAALHGYDVVVASSSNRALVRRIRALPGWRVVYDRKAGIAAVRGPN